MERLSGRGTGFGLIWDAIHPGMASMKAMPSFRKSGLSRSETVSPSITASKSP
jgi:hypothetical protein